MYWKWLTQNPARLSQALIIPFIGHPEGFAALYTITNAGHRDAAAVVSNSHAAINHLEWNVECMRRIKWHLENSVGHLCLEAGYTSMQFSNPNFVATIHPRYHEVIACQREYIQHVDEELPKMILRVEAAEEFYHAVFKLFQQFGTICRVARCLFRLHDEFGVGMMADWEGIIKAIICMKCLDAAWEEMRVMYKQVREMEKEIKNQEPCIFPFEDYAPWDRPYPWHL